ncbi:MAG: hypothetical protein NTZ12_06345 [Candidatus Aminicenantes bacterium]|nr:hypothetical protein [Candidatus Aminicenantes bacterium]
MRKTTCLVVMLLLVTYCLASVKPMSKESKKKTFEITINGGYNLFSGTRSGVDVPVDLFTGDWSPFFGEGYNTFNWLNLAGHLDSVVGKPVLEQKNGAAVGIKVGANITPNFQIELFFNYVMAAMQFTDEAWSTYNKVVADDVSAMQLFHFNPVKTENSVQSSGKSMQFGLNLNVNLMAKGKFIPYLSLGAFVSKFSSPPSISYELTQGTGATATYKLVIDYTPRTSIGFGGGLGGKLFFSDAIGLKIEFRANLVPFKIDQNVTTTFAETASYFTDFTNTSKVAVTEKINQVMLGASLGLFYTF